MHDEITLMRNESILIPDEASLMGDEKKLG
jgi:hypothetical protein